MQLDDPLPRSQKPATDADTDKVKVKFTLEQVTKDQMGSRRIALIFSLTSAVDEGG